jgi:hypothetical protein
LLSPTRLSSSAVLSTQIAAPAQVSNWHKAAEAKAASLRQLLGE